MAVQYHIKTVMQYFSLFIYIIHLQWRERYLKTVTVILKPHTNALQQYHNYFELGLNTSCFTWFQPFQNFPSLATYSSSITFILHCSQLFQLCIYCALVFRLLVLQNTPTTLFSLCVVITATFFFFF